MRVLWLRPSKGDNVSVRRERIAEHLRARGVEVDIQDSSGFDGLAAIKRALLGDYDVIAGNVRMGLYVGYPLARLLRTPFLGDVSDPLTDIEHLPWPLYRMLGWYEWKVLKHADAAVFVHESSYREAKRLGIHGVKLANAVDFETFANPDEEVVRMAREILNEEAVDFEKPIAIFVGALTGSHHITDILGAAEITPDWEFVFVGEGPLASAVEMATSESENVHFPGAFEYGLMPGFLHHAAVGFSLKDAEQSLKLKEYGAAGIPAIVQRGVLEDWYSEDELMFVKPTPTEISNRLNDLLEVPHLLSHGGENLQRVAQNYSWETVATEYYELFEEITSS